MSQVKLSALAALGIIGPGSRFNGLFVHPKGHNIRRAHTTCGTSFSGSSSNLTAVIMRRLITTLDNSPQTSGVFHNPRYYFPLYSTVHQQLNTLPDKQFI